MPKIDYNALARQAGAIDPAQPDYAALAKQAGAISSTPPPSDPNRPAGLPPGVDLPQLAAHPAVNMQPSILGRDPNPGPVANFFKGAVKSIPGTMAGIAKLVSGHAYKWNCLYESGDDLQ